MWRTDAIGWRQCDLGLPSLGGSVTLASPLIFFHRGTARELFDTTSYIPSLIKIGSGIQKSMGRDIHTARWSLKLTFKFFFFFF
jgi:hypothetical protein